MARHISGGSISEVWDELLYALMIQGKESSPRGHSTREILNVTIEVHYGLNNILVNPVRGLNYRFMIAEWLWIMAGLNDVHILARYNSAMRQFSDDGNILSGAYGPRLMPQIPYILSCLKKPDSRQAVATIWTPSPTHSKDIPCTVSMQWFIREGKLHCTINMRSSDVWLGLPYDYFTFSQITNYIAMLMVIPVSSITMNLGSSHIYKTNWESASTIIGNQEEPRESNYVSSPQIPGYEILDARDLETILRREYAPLPLFWHPYSDALINGSQNALEVLRGIEPKT